MTVNFDGSWTKLTMDMSPGFFVVSKGFVTLLCSLLLGEASLFVIKRSADSLEFGSSFFPSCIFLNISRKLPSFLNLSADSVGFLSTCSSSEEEEEESRLLSSEDEGNSPSDLDAIFTVLTREMSERDAVEPNLFLNLLKSILKSNLLRIEYLFNI